jgi:hypothetical protein
MGAFACEIQTSAGGDEELVYSVPSTLYVKETYQCSFMAHILLVNTRSHFARFSVAMLNMVP